MENLTDLYNVQCEETEEDLWNDGFCPDCGFPWVSHDETCPVD